MKSALYNCKIPRVSSALLDGGNVDLILTDDPHDCDRLNVDTYPLLVTMSKIGEHCIVDPTTEEETCSNSSVVIGVSFQPKDDNGYVTTIKTIGVGSIHPDTLDTCLDLGISAARSLNGKLMEALKMEEKQIERSGKSAISKFLN